MTLHSTYPTPGIYLYSYPTFTDTPQHICVHFLTPDNQNAFVSYPKHPNHKASQLIPVRWFDSVHLVKLNGYPQLMHFLEVVLPKLLNSRGPELVIDNRGGDQLGSYEVGIQSAA